MPSGLVFMRWDERSGANVLLKYPEDIEINGMTLMQVYSQHEYSGEAGTVSLSAGDVTIVSYYSGPLKSYYILLILNQEEDPDDYESCVINVSQIILQNIKEEKYKELIPSLYDRILAQSTFTEEQKLLLVMQNEFYRLIIDRLRDEGVAEKSEVRAWLKDKYRRSYIDTEAVITELIKLGVIKESSISSKGIPPLLLFFIGDLLMYRYPPKKAHDAVREEILKFFESYNPSGDDNLKIIEVLVNPIAYELLCLLRTESVTRDTIYEIVDKTPEDIDPFLNRLVEVNLIKIFKINDSKEHFSLFSDVQIEKIFPVYVFNIIKSSYTQKTKANQVLIEYLDVLEKAYFG